MTSSTAPFLAAEKVSRSFQLGDRKIPVLDGIDLAVARGETLAVTGPSGSGKSTLLSLLAGLDRPTQGRVLFDGMDLAIMGERELARLRSSRIGFVFQSYRLLPTLTAEENVMVPLELAGHPHAKTRAHQWLEQVGLSHRLNHHPAQLSGGEQQRVALARAMAPGPEVLFADEPTGNLDSRTGAEMADLMFRLAKERGVTVVLVTHETEMARRAQRHIELKDGRVLRR